MSAAADTVAACQVPARETNLSTPYDERVNTRAPGDDGDRSVPYGGSDSREMLVTHATYRVARESRGTASSGWLQSYGRMLVVSDLLVITAAMFVGLLVGEPIGPGAPWPPWSETPFKYEAALLAGALWALVLAVSGSRAPRMLGTGVTEYRRVTHSTLLAVGAVGVAAYVASVPGLASLIVIAFPVGLVMLLGERWAWRRWLASRRRAGEMSHRVLLVGSAASIAGTAQKLRRAPEAGFRVVGGCAHDGEPDGVIGGTDVPSFGSTDDILATLERSGADTVVITSSHELTPEAVRRLSWQLEPGRQHLVVAPSLTDIGGPRIHTRPVAGLPFIHVETPRYEGGKLYAKRVFDIAASSLLILVFAPLLGAIALVVRATTTGDVIFRQGRVGLGGEPFSMLKFRSMYSDAEERLEALLADERSAGNSVLFKMKNDPRVTPVGAVLRRFSLDELPQLFNVFLGHMSLVGPRPPLEREVEQYDRHVHRRFLVKPGITGLWQVSGRSNLDWEETVRLDLYYVENWTMTGDLAILWRTLRAVVHRDGAY